MVSHFLTYLQNQQLLPRENVIGMTHQQTYFILLSFYAFTGDPKGLE